jgi:hypothetical protein
VQIESVEWQKGKLGRIWGNGFANQKEHVKKSGAASTGNGGEED